MSLAVANGVVVQQEEIGTGLFSANGVLFYWEAIVGVKLPVFMHHYQQQGMI